MTATENPVTGTDHGLSLGKAGQAITGARIRKPLRRSRPKAFSNTHQEKFMRSLAFLAVTLLTSQLAFAGAKVDRTPLVTQGTAEAALVRNNNHLSVSGRATGLIPGNTYTVWWIVTDSSGPVVVNATGGIANAAGEYRFGGALQTGTYEPGETTPRFVLVGGSLVDPINATVVLHVVDHGPPIPGLIPTQISEISAAGCPVGCGLFTEIIFAP